MKFQHLSLNRQMGIAFSVLVAILIGVTALSVYSLAESQNDFDHFVNDEFSRGGLARDVRAAASARAVSARNLILLTGKNDIESETMAVKAAHERVQERIAMLRTQLADNASVTQEERDLFQQLVAIEAQYGPVALDIVDKALTGRKEEAILKMNAECQPLLKQLIGTATAYAKLIATAGSQEIKQSAERFRRKRFALLLASAGAIGAAIGLALLINRSVMRSLGADPRELRAAARRAASGDLNPVPGAAKAPPNSVLASLGEMQVALAAIVARVRTTANAIELGSKEIAAGNSDLSARTEQQADSLQHSAVSMQRITVSVGRNADAAEEVSELAVNARATAENGGTMVASVVSTMEDIRASSHRIADISTVIDGLAFQTNLLALNAAVEAARAGEQGRGFAVVAGEVRTLAQRSAAAAKEIRELVGASVAKVEAGASVVGNAGGAMTDIVGEVARVANLMGEISAATREQTTSVGDISDTVAALDVNTQQNAALVEQMAAAAETLNRQAHGLVDAVAVFHLPPEYERRALGIA